ncbi:MAG: signal peptidase I [Clostridia bacterium]|nr:signal peptidase I [Clostridia bacterium]
MTPEDQAPEQPETEEKAEGTVEEAPQEKPEKKSLGREILEWVVTIVAAVAIALVIRTFIFEPVRVDGQSMDDTLADGEIMIVSKLGYSSFDFIGGRVSAFGNPKRFDVVICRYPGRGYTNFVKRVVGLPGDTVSVQDGYLYINDEKYDEPYINDDYRSGYLNNFAPFTVPDGQYFVMGDHRNNSNDSRSIGPIDRNMIVGHVVQVVFPFSSFRSIPNGLNVKAQ